LTGDRQEGAAYWAAERSKAKPGTCAPQGQALGDWTVGCLEAQQHLAHPDVRRRTDPQYWFGWNARTGEPPAPKQRPQESAELPPRTVQPELPPAARPEQPQSRPASPKRPEPRSLQQMLADCDNAARGVGQLSLPGADGEVPLDRCYRGRDHLECTIKALLTEARTINHEYEDLINSNYPNLGDENAICRIDPKTLAAQAEQANKFDARKEAENKEFAGRADCMRRVDESLHNIRLPDLANAPDILQSLFKNIQSEMETVSNAQKDILDLGDKIERSQKAMITIQKVHKTICRQAPEPSDGDLQQSNK
jgi:hypothetical protein